MAMRVHELHPSLVHAPLALLPASAVLELMAAVTRRRIRRRALDAVARRMWWGTAGSALLAGLAGMAASQEVEVRGSRPRDAMLVHGLGNVALVLGAFGLAAWRTSHRASAVTAAIGAGAAAASLYTAWLGGQLVYAHGVGVKAGDEDRAPALFSAQAPARLAKDAAGGLRWLLRQGGRKLSGREALDPHDVSTPKRKLPEYAPPPLH